MSEICVFYNLRRVGRLVGQVFDAHLAKAGIKSTQFSLLSALNFLAPITLGDFAEKIDIDRTTLTRNLKVLEKEGLLEINQGKDRRTRLIQLTVKGKDLTREAVPYWKEAQTAILSHFGDERWQDMMEELESLAVIARENVRERQTYKVT